MTINKNELTICKKCGLPCEDEYCDTSLGPICEYCFHEDIENDFVQPCEFEYIDDYEATPLYRDQNSEEELTASDFNGQIFYDSNQLKQKYCIADFKNAYLESILIPILVKLDQRLEITDSEVNWLIQHHIYIVAAQVYYTRYQKGGRLWELTKACRYYRICGHPKKVIEITDVNAADCKVLAALKTTRGGAYRDLGKLSKAFDCANRAIEYNPWSFRAYTLKGALHFDIREYEQGYQCFLKAQELGALEAAVNKNLTSIVNSSSLHQQEIAQFLFNKDPYRFNWASAYLKNNVGCGYPL